MFHEGNTPGEPTGAEKPETGLSGSRLAMIATRRSLLLQGASVLALLAPVRQALAQKKGKPAPAAATTGAWDDRWELAVNFEIGQPTGARYQRPYVAVWIEDKDGVPVRTLCLWVQNTGRGPRWIPDLKRWIRGERLRQLADGKDLVASVSSPTRMPGSYKLVWNGKDDQGEKVRQGAYSLCIEAAREHGTYQLIRKPITIGKQPFRTALEGNIEITKAAVEYRQRA